MIRSSWLPAVLAALAVACGGGDDPAPEDPPGCTGDVPSSATLCPGADQGLEADTPRVVVSTCAIPRACSYACNPGFVLSGGACQAAGVCTGDAPEHATLCPGSDQGLLQDTARILRGACNAPCAYTCDEGFVFYQDTCAPVTSGEATFTDNGDGTVTVEDPAATLRWLKDANCRATLGGVSRAAGAIAYVDALAWSEALASGACGLTDGSAVGDWRLPDDAELQLLSADLRGGGETGWDAFDGIQGGSYWTTFSTCTGIYGVVEISTGIYLDVDWAETHHVWPVREVP